MRQETAALIIQEGSRLISALIRNRDILFHTSADVSPEEDHDEAPLAITQENGKATSIANGCVPCSIGHLGTCSGLLNEAMRFARNGGIQSNDVIERVNICLDELNALERVDLRPERIVNLPVWEKALAVKALDASRALRHDLEGLSDVSSLEEVSAKTQSIRMDIGKSWYRERLSRMTPEQRQQVEDELTRRAAQRNNEEQQEIR